MPTHGADQTGEPESAAVVARVRRFVEAQGWAADEIEALAGDVSARRYFRVSNAHRSAIVCAYPEDQWPVAERLVLTGELLAGVGIRVPAVLAADQEQLLMLLEDVGASTCYELAVEVEADTAEMFDRAGRMIPRILALDLSRRPGLLPPLDGSALDEELAASVEGLQAWAADLGAVTGLNRLTQPVRQSIADAVATMPLRPAHRDFMLRNLVPMPDGSLAVLDHQDLRPAPFGYDFASLVNDSVFPSHENADALRRRWLPDLTPELYHWLAAQRTLKAAGTYARASAAGNTVHEHLILPTLNRFVEHIDRCAGAVAVAEFRTGLLDRLQR